MLRRDGALRKSGVPCLGSHCEGVNLWQYDVQGRCILFFSYWGKESRTSSIG